MAFNFQMGYPFAGWLATELVSPFATFAGWLLPSTVTVSGSISVDPMRRYVCFNLMHQQWEGISLFGRERLIVPSVTHIHTNRDTLTAAALDRLCAAAAAAAVTALLPMPFFILAGFESEVGSRTTK